MPARRAQPSSSAPKRSNEATQLIYLALAYWLVPGIARLAGAEGLAGIDWPVGGFGLVWSHLPPY